LAYPASVSCVKQGGTLEMRAEASGTVGSCRLPDGMVIEDWAEFCANNP
jgi:putative hemolysin